MTKSQLLEHICSLPMPEQIELVEAVMHGLGAQLRGTASDHIDNQTISGTNGKRQHAPRSSSIAPMRMSRYGIAWTENRYMSMTRGQIWQVDLAPTIGAEMTKIRPALIVNSDVVGVLPLKVWFRSRPGRMRLSSFLGWFVLTPMPRMD